MSIYYLSIPSIFVILIKLILYISSLLLIALIQCICLWCYALHHTMSCEYCYINKVALLVFQKWQHGNQMETNEFLWIFTGQSVMQGTFSQQLCVFQKTICSLSKQIFFLCSPGGERKVGYINRDDKWQAQTLSSENCTSYKWLRCSLWNWSGRAAFTKEPAGIVKIIIMINC